MRRRPLPLLRHTCSLLDSHLHHHRAPHQHRSQLGQRQQPGRLQRTCSLWDSRRRHRRVPRLRTSLVRRRLAPGPRIHQATLPRSVGHFPGPCAAAPQFHESQAAAPRDLRSRPERSAPAWSSGLSKRLQTVPAAPRAVHSRTPAT